MPTQDKWVTYAKEHKKEFLERIIPTPLPDKEDRVAYLTAGGPGSGKSEFREAVLPSKEQVCIIDPDEFRQFFPGYDGKNAADYQHAASYLVDYCFGKLIRKKLPMVLDSTFGGRRALQNIQRLLDHDFTVKLFYVYEHPQAAWDFAQHRSRKVPREAFERALAHAYDNIGAAWDEYHNNERFKLYLFNQQEHTFTRCTSRHQLDTLAKSIKEV